jgi:hypothetical protein
MEDFDARRDGQGYGPDPLAVTVEEGRRIIGLGTTKVWELIASGDLKSLRIGRRRLILYQSIRDLIARQMRVEDPRE